MTIGAAIAQANQSLGATGAVPWPASASVAHLKVNGTATVASLPMKISSPANATRALRSRRSLGQMYGHMWMSVANSAPLLALTFPCGD